MKTYQVTFSYSIEVDVEGDDLDAEKKAFEEFEQLLRTNPPADFFDLYDVSEIG